MPLQRFPLLQPSPRSGKLEWFFHTAFSFHCGPGRMADASAHRGDTPISCRANRESTIKAVHPCNRCPQRRPRAPSCKQRGSIGTPPKLRAASCTISASARFCFTDAPGSGSRVLRRGGATSITPHLLLHRPGLPQHPGFPSRLRPSLIRVRSWPSRR